MPATHSSMHVLIVGSGIGGLMLAALLEKAGISYQVFEKALEVKPLGSAMSLGAHILPVFKQLGIFDEFKRHALPINNFKMTFYPEGKTRSEDHMFLKRRYGEYVHIIDRPKLYEILSSLVPKDKILYGKKVLSIEQNAEGAMIRCNDHTMYHGTVLIGADGAYSAIRKALYKQMKSKGLLPKDDDTDPPFNTYCLVGVTNPMPPDSYEVEEGWCRGEAILYKNSPYCTSFFSKKDGGVEWVVTENASTTRTRKDDQFRNSDWGTEGAWTMVEKVRDLPSPFGPPLSVFIDNTPKDGISKVRLEEKLYKTWNFGRTALLGDACHKFHPGTGQGAINAMLDAVVLANVLHACPTSTIEDVRRCLNAYTEERYPCTKRSYDVSVKGGQLSKQTLWGAISRFIFHYLLPRRLILAAWDDMYTHQPQAAFLPYNPPEGTFRPVPQTNYDCLRKPASTIAV